jgi:hypothetical protein
MSASAAGHLALQKGSQVYVTDNGFYKGLKIYSKIWYEQKCCPQGEWVIVG